MIMVENNVAARILKGSFYMFTLFFFSYFGGWGKIKSDGRNRVHPIDLWPLSGTP